MASLGDQYDGIIVTKNDKPLIGLKSITFILKLYSYYWIVPKCKDLKFIVLESILVVESKESVLETCSTKQIEGKFFVFFILKFDGIYESSKINKLNKQKMAKVHVCFKHFYLVTQS